MSDCVFCDLIAKKANLLFEGEHVIVMMSPEPSVPGHLLVLPKLHSPILEGVPDFIVAEMFKVGNKASLMLFESLGVKGVNVLLQNGVVAGQRNNHVMLSVVPRFDNDGLSLSWTPKPAAPEDLAKTESKLKDETRNVGVFEREKPKPIEIEKPKEVKDTKTDYRIKQLKRVP